MTTSQVIRTLEQAGLVNRQPHHTNARAHLVTITAAGQRLANLATPHVEAIDREFFAPLGDTRPHFFGAYMYWINEQPNQERASADLSVTNRALTR